MLQVLYPFLEGPSQPLVSPTRAASGPYHRKPHHDQGHHPLVWGRTHQRPKRWCLHNLASAHLAPNPLACSNKRMFSTTAHAAAYCNTAKGNNPTNKTNQHTNHPSKDAQSKELTSSIWASVSGTTKGSSSKSLSAKSSTLVGFLVRLSFHKERTRNPGMLCHFCVCALPSVFGFLSRDSFGACGQEQQRTQEHFTQQHV